MNNPLLFPEYVRPGTILTRQEFEDCAEEARMVDDLLDRDDLSTHEFIKTCISRANARRTPQNLHLWVGSVNFQNVFLVSAPLARVVDTLRNVACAHEIFLVNIQEAITATLKEGARD